MLAYFVFHCKRRQSFSTFLPLRAMNRQHPCSLRLKLQSNRHIEKSSRVVLDEKTSGFIIKSDEWWKWQWKLKMFWQEQLRHTSNRMQIELLLKCGFNWIPPIASPNFHFHHQAESWATQISRCLLVIFTSCWCVCIDRCLQYDERDTRHDSNYYLIFKWSIKDSIPLLRRLLVFSAMFVQFIELFALPFFFFFPFATSILTLSNWKMEKLFKETLRNYEIGMKVLFSRFTDVDNWLSFMLL